MNWYSMFSKTTLNRGATNEELFVMANSLKVPLNASERQSVLNSLGTHALLNESRWIFPKSSLPETYKELLRWSNGGVFLSSRFAFDPLFSCGQVREYLIGHCFPFYMPKAIPFALNGSGGFFVFDLRSTEMDGSCPILLVDSGDLSFESAKVVARSFAEMFERE